MSIKYRKRKYTLSFDKENKVQKYVATNVLVGNVAYSKLCNEVNQRTGIHRSMVDIVLAGVQDTMVAFIEEGLSVRLGNFGSFRPSLKAESQDSPENVDASTVVRKKIVFTPGSAFKNMLDSASLELFDDDTAKAAGGTTKDPDTGGDTSGGGGGSEETPDPSA